MSDDDDHHQYHYYDYNDDHYDEYLCHCAVPIARPERRNPSGDEHISNHTNTPVTIIMIRMMIMMVMMIVVMMPIVIMEMNIYTITQTPLFKVLCNGQI